MTFSFVVPVYDTKKEYFEQCILSLINQSYKDYEIIVVDDGSSPSYADYLDDMQERFAVGGVKLSIYHIDNCGSASARNYGISVCSGDWVVFVDSDDWIEKNMLTHFNDRINQNTDIIICSNYINFEQKQFINELFNEELIVYEKDKTELEIQAIWKKTFDTFPPYNSVATCWGKTYRASFLKENNIRFPKDMTISEDTTFNLYAFEASRHIIYSNVCLYHYRQNRKSITRSQRSVEMKLKDQLRIYNEFNKFLDFYKKDSMMYQAMYLRLFYGLCDICSSCTIGQIEDICNISEFKIVVNHLDFQFLPNDLKRQFTYIQNEKFTYLRIMYFNVHLKAILYRYASKVKHIFDNK